MNFRQLGLKYKFMIIAIAAIIITAAAGGWILHQLITSTGVYSGTYVWLVGVFYVLVGIVGVLALSKFMIQPVVFLTEKVYQVQRGNLNVRIKRQRNTTWMDEMDRLFEGFDHMVQHLRETIEALTLAKEKAETASQELFESKKKLEAIFNSLSDGIMIIDNEFRILSANPVMARFMGRSVNEVFNQHCYQMCNGSVQHCSFCRAHITFNTGNHVSTYCTKNIGPDQSERILEVHDFPLYDEKGEIKHIIEYVKDVTDAVKMQANLESSRRLAEIGQMAAKVAHEVRNPLNAIKGATHYLRSEIQDANHVTYLNLIEEQVQRVNDVATNLLNLSKPLKPVFQPGQLGKVIDSSLTITDKLLKDKNIKISLHLAEGIPHIPLDEKRMEQALVNLILNAVDAMKPGGELTISVDLHGQQDCNRAQEVLVRVADTGCGIEAKELSEIFEPFFTTKTKGTGLGLTIVKKVIDQHQGKISIESEKGRGTTISLRLPIKPVKYETREHYFSH